jgi:hypothetical protein
MIRITGFDDDAWRPLGPPHCDMQVLSDSQVSTVLGFRIGAGAVARASTTTPSIN